MRVISTFATKMQPCIGSHETFAFIVVSNDEVGIREVLGKSRKNFGVYTVSDEPRFRRDAKSFTERGNGVICAAFARMKGEVAAAHARRMVVAEDIMSSADML